MPNTALIAKCLLAGTAILTGALPSDSSITWTSGPDMPLPRGGYSAAWQSEGLLIAGGTYWTGGKKLWTDRVHCFEPESATWREWKPLPRRLAYGVMAASPRGTFLFGGSDEQRTYRDVYRLTGEAWNRVGESPTPLVYASAACVGTRIYIIAGGSSVTDLTQASTAVWAFETADGRWQAMDPLPGPPRTLHTSTALGGRIFVFGGATQQPGTDLVNLDDAHSLDPASGHWKALRRTPEPVRASWAEADERSIYLLGGYSDRFLPDVYRYDPVADDYERLSSLPVPLCDAKFFLWKGHLYGAGGEDRGGSRFAGTLLGRLN